MHELWVDPAPARIDACAIDRATRLAPGPPVGHRTVWSGKRQAEARMRGVSRLALPGRRPAGAIVDGIRNEDLERPSLADGSMDVIVSSDVFEHVIDIDRPWRGSRACLRPMASTCGQFPRSRRS